MQHHAMILDKYEQINAHDSCPDSMKHKKGLPVLKGVQKGIIKMTQAHWQWL